jgi:hypothetical protein
MMGTLRILQMMFATQSGQEQDIEEVFEKPEQECLKELNIKLQGQTDRLKNPNKPTNIKWAA